MSCVKWIKIKYNQGNAYFPLGLFILKPNGKFKQLNYRFLIGRYYIDIMIWHNLLQSEIRILKMTGEIECLA